MEDMRGMEVREEVVDETRRLSSMGWERVVVGREVGLLERERVACLPLSRRVTG